MAQVSTVHPTLATMALPMATIIMAPTPPLMALRPEPSTLAQSVLAMVAIMVPPRLASTETLTLALTVLTPTAPTVPRPEPPTLALKELLMATSLAMATATATRATLITQPNLTAMATVVQLQVTVESVMSLLPMVTAMSATDTQLRERLSIKSGLHTTNMLKTTAKVSTVNICMRQDMAALPATMIQTTAPPNNTALQATETTTPIRVMLTTLMLALKP